MVNYGRAAHALALTIPLSEAVAAVRLKSSSVAVCGPLVPSPPEGVLSSKKGTGTICAKHPKGRSGKWWLSPF
jgi:hypothetical protein